MRIVALLTVRNEERFIAGCLERALGHGVEVDAADRAGANAVQFQEFTFAATREHRDHDRPRYMETMLWYCPSPPRSPHRLNAWRKGPEPPVYDPGELVAGWHRSRAEFAAAT